MKNTPGPWENDGNDIWAADHVIATVIGAKDQNGLFTNPSRVRADSALIAAAPDLLSALRELVDYDEGSSEPEDYGYEVLQRCKAAIAKAEGKVPENT